LRGAAIIRFSADLPPMSSRGGGLENPGLGTPRRWSMPMSATEVRDLSKEFLEHVYAIPEGEKINQCIQCGTCSASCPSAEAMEYGPREIIAALRAGMLDRMFESNTVWLCASCYLCTVRCPAGIPFTDVMYELKRLGVKKGLYAKGTPNAVMARIFVDSVQRYGRNAEMRLIRLFFMKTNPLKGVGMVPLGLKLLKKKRLKFGVKKIKGIEGLRKMLAAVEEEEAQR